MSSELEPWDSEMSALIDAARADVKPPEGALERVERRLALSTATRATAVERPSMRQRYRYALAALAIAAAFAGGFFVHAVLRPPHAGKEARATPTTHSSKAPAQTYVPPSDSTAALSGFSSSSRDLLDEAAAKLEAGDPEGALAALDDHARKFPKGPLTELREALSIEALVRAGRADEARERGERFLEEHPQSLLRPAVRDALGTIR